MRDKLRRDDIRRFALDYQNETGCTFVRAIRSVLQARIIGIEAETFPVFETQQDWADYYGYFSARDLTWEDWKGKAVKPLDCGHYDQAGKRIIIGWY